MDIMPLVKRADSVEVIAKPLPLPITKKNKSLIKKQLRELNKV